MAERVEFDVSEVGTLQTASGFDTLSGSIGQSAAAAATADRAMGTKTSGLAGSVGALGTAVASANPQFAQFAGVVGGAGGAVSALSSVISGPMAIAGAGLIALLGVIAVATSRATKETEKLAKAEEKAAAAAAEEQAALINLAAQISAVSKEKARTELQSRILTGGAAVEQQKAAVRIAEEGLKQELARQNAERIHQQFLTEGERRVQRRIREAFKKNVVFAKENLKTARDLVVADEQVLVQEELIAEAKAKAAEADKAAKAAAKDPAGDPIFEAQERADANRKRIESIRQLEADASLEKRQRATDDHFAELARMEEKDALEAEFAMENERRREEAARDTKKFLDEEATARKLNNEQAKAGVRILGSTAIGALQDIAKGNEVNAAQILESLGDQIVAEGQKWVFTGIGMSIMGLPQGPPLITLGLTEIGFGIGLGAAGAAAAGGAGGGGGTTVSAEERQTRRVSRERFADVSGDGGGGGDIINVQFRSVMRPTAEDGAFIGKAIQEGKRVNGTSGTRL